ncbi:DUF4350 domain-containing protein [Hymenobacter sp.]|uniref:DUF4350 domain-containing protein n=1 Tax=Hymenobacter sp. TaxID=1898978 RepID=UPI00286CD406|nr:DUF4350 domain-containing protein [Hymenobacter sp.]
MKTSVLLSCLAGTLLACTTSSRPSATAPVAAARPVTVTLDNYFNREFRTGPDGRPELFHYTWEDKQDSGYSQWGAIFTSKGAVLATLPTAPTRENLLATDLYIISDPDTERETPQPNYMTDSHVAAVTRWVREGGVLVLLANDSANAELTRFNQLAAQFGLAFTNKTRNAVVREDLSIGKIVVAEANPVLHVGSTLYLKGISTLRATGGATPLLTDRGDVIMATARLGKGTVFAVGDPWIYNEYIGNTHLPAEFQNNVAAEELTTWLLNQVPPRRTLGGR